MIDKKKFEAFEMVRESGVTNMFVVPEVIKLAKMQTGIKLTKQDVTEIFRNYSQLKAKFLR